MILHYITTEDQTTLNGWQVQFAVNIFKN